MGFAEHEDSDVDEEADSARQKSAASARRAGLKVAFSFLFFCFLFFVVFHSKNTVSSFCVHSILSLRRIAHIS